VTIARDGVRSGPRRFVLRLDGFAPYTVLQGDSEGIVRVLAPLVRSSPGASAVSSSPAPTPSSSVRSSASSATPSPGRSAPGHPTTPRAATSMPAPPTQQDLDIKLTR